MDIEVSSLGHLIVPDIPDMKIKQLTLWGSQWLGAKEAQEKPTVSGQRTRAEQPTKMESV